jgi:uncharacterized membrane protein
MNLKLYIICTATILALMCTATASGTATIHGAVYKWDTFEPLDNAVIEVNSIPTQEMVARNGQYSIELVPGTYSIKVIYYQNNTLTYYKEKTIEIQDDESYVLDLLVPPVNSSSQKENAKESVADRSTDVINNSSGVGINNGLSQSVNEEQKTTSTPVISNLVPTIKTSVYKKDGLNSSITYLLIALICFIFITGTYFFLIKHRQITKNDFKLLKTLKLLVKTPAMDKEPEPRQDSKVNTEEAVSVAAEESKINEKNKPSLDKHLTRNPKLVETISDDEKRKILPEELASNSEIETPAPKKKLLLPSDLQEVIDVIKSQGGLISQKDLRGKLNYSEVKVSVMLSDLEKIKRIKKFKKGRENFVVLIDWKR